MRPINPKKNKSFSFLLGLIYGYRTADMELKVRPLDEFDKSLHPDFDIYYLDRINDRVSKNEPIDSPTHIIALKEDFEVKKVRIYIYRS